MGWPMAAAMGGSAVLGAMGNGKQARAANRPRVSTSRNTPWNQGIANNWASGYDNAFQNAIGNVQHGPRGFQQAMFGDMMGYAFPGGGGRGSGGGGAGAPQWHGGGMGGNGIFNRLAKNNVAFNDYEQRVLSDDFMDWENNPILAQRLEALRQENQEALGQAQSQSIGQFIGSGGTMGMTGAMLAARAKMADDYGENLGQQQAGFIGDYDAQLRQQQAAANQAWSQREATYDASGFQNHAQRAAAAAAAAASRYASDTQRAIANAQLGAQNDAQRWSQMMGMWGIGNQMHGLMQQGEGLGQLGMYHDYGQSMLPYQQYFGTNRTVNPGAGVSPFNAMGSGAMSGLGWGHQLGTQLGFAPFRGAGGAGGGGR